MNQSTDKHTTSSSLPSLRITRMIEQIRFLQGCTQPEYLASGSRGTVYCVEKDGKKYALKVIDCGNNFEKLRSTRSEIQMMRMLRDNGKIVQLLDSEILRDGDGTVVFLLQPYVTSFEEYYKSHKMSVSDVLQMGIDLCDALDYCWGEGVAHLDIQPKNLFVDDSGRFLLGDFSAAAPVAFLAMEDDLRGTLSYMAPEVYTHKRYSQASEIYALGMVLYCVLNKGYLPFMEDSFTEKNQADRQQAINPLKLAAKKHTAVMTRLENRKPLPSLHLDDAVEFLLQQALAVKPENRFQSFRAMQNALKGTLAAVSPQQLPAEPSWAARAFPPSPAMVPAPIPTPAPAPSMAPAPAMAPKRKSSPWQFSFIKNNEKTHKEERRAAPGSFQAPSYSQPTTSTASGNLFDSDRIATSCTTEALSSLPPSPGERLIPPPPTHSAAPQAPAGASVPPAPVGHTIPVNAPDRIPFPAPSASAMPAPTPIELSERPFNPAPTAPSASTAFGNLFDSDPYATTCTTEALSSLPPSPGERPIPPPPTYSDAPQAPAGASVPPAPVGHTIPVNAPDRTPFPAPPSSAMPSPAPIDFSRRSFNPASAAPSASKASGNLFIPIITCPNGHYYNSDIYPHCPECGAAASVGSARNIPAVAPAYSADFSSANAAYAPTPYAPPPRMNQVQFSAIAPKEARKEDYSIIQLFMYEQAFRAVVDEAIAMAESLVQEKRSGFQKVRENTRVKVVLTCPDMPIDDNVQEQVWCGGYLQFDFAICPPESLKKRQILLTASVYFDDIPATRLMLTVKALASYDEEIELQRQDIITAFVSYASQDRRRVGALVQGMRKARPDMDIFFDVTSLRSGDDWERSLYHEILRRDILFLCWSRNAQASDWVEREWRFALENKGLDCIEPIPLEQPDVCPPPRELWSKHFNDSLLYIIDR